MDASSTAIASSPLATPGASAAAPALSAADGVRGAEFANLLQHLMAPLGRQGLAAVGGGGLQALALSPNIQVITADEPLPDSDSLLAFARSQGLDDLTLRSLFQTTDGAAGPPEPLPGVLAAPGPASNGLPAGTAAPDVPRAWAWAASPGPTSPAVPTLSALFTLTQEPVAMGAAASCAPPGASGAAPAPAQAAALAPHVPTHLTPAPGAPTLGSLVALGGLSMRSLSVHTGGAHAAANVPPALAGLQTGTPQSAQASPSVPAVQAQPTGPQLPDLMRLNLQPQEAITRRLAGLAGSGQPLAWGQVTGQPVVECLSLTPGEMGDPGDPAGQGAPREQGPSGLTAAAGPDSGRAPGAASTAQDAAPASTAAQRTAHYQQLAERLGQALGQRLQAQIERGQWRVQMQLDPAHLGRIDMELDMRSGGLEAVFRSDNPLTRELITQGLPRLRESLQFSGTAVANVWVQGDSSRQPGGNPTPWRGPAPVLPDVNEPEAHAPLAQPVAPRMRGDTGAWDVLA